MADIYSFKKLGKRMGKKLWFANFLKKKTHQQAILRSQFYTWSRSLKEIGIKPIPSKRGWSPQLNHSLYLLHMIFAVVSLRSNTLSTNAFLTPFRPFQEDLPSTFPPSTSFSKNFSTSTLCITEKNYIWKSQEPPRS